MSDLKFSLVIEGSSAEELLKNVQNQAEKLRTELDKEQKVKVDGRDALSTFRDVGLVFQQVYNVLSGAIDKINEFMDANFEAQKAVNLANNAFGDASFKMQEFASSMQQVTNFEGDALLEIFAKMKTTFGLTSDEIMKLTPAVLDFAEANGFDAANAFDLFGKALNGHTEMMGKYGIELDKVRLQSEGLSYITEVLNDRYAGTAQAVADVRMQTENIIGDAKESIGAFLQDVLTPLIVMLGKGATVAGNFFRSLTETSLEKTIREMREMGVAAKDIWELEKFGMEQRLIEINAQLKESGLSYQKIEEITSRINTIKQEEIELIKKRSTDEKAIYEIDKQRAELQKKKDEDWGAHTNEELVAFTMKMDGLVQERKLYDSHILVIKNRMNELSKEADLIAKHNGLLIERAKLESQIAKGFKEPEPEVSKIKQPYEEIAKETDYVKTNVDEIIASMRESEEVEVLPKIEFTLVSAEQLLRYERMIKEQKIADFWKQELHVVGDAFNALMSGMLQIETRTNNRLIQGFINMANAFIAEVERMIAKWLALQAVQKATEWGLGGIFGGIGSFIAGLFLSVGDVMPIPDSVGGGSSQTYSTELGRKIDRLIEITERKDLAVTVNVKDRSRVELHKENMEAEIAYNRQVR